MKSISTINPTIMENMECIIAKARPSYWYKSGCVALTRSIIILHFASSSSNIWLTFQAKNNVRSAPACTHLPKSHTEAIMRISQIVTYAVREKGLEYKGEQRWALVEPWCKHWSCCGWWKRRSLDEATLNSEEIKPVAIAIIELCLSEGISKGVSESVSHAVSRKFD